MRVVFPPKIRTATTHRQKHTRELAHLVRCNPSRERVFRVCCCRVRVLFVCVFPVCCAHGEHMFDTETHTRARTQIQACNYKSACIEKHTLARVRVGLEPSRVRFKCVCLCVCIFFRVVVPANRRPRSLHARTRSTTATKWRLLGMHMFYAFRIIAGVVPVLPVVPVFVCQRPNGFNPQLIRIG